MAGFIVTNPCRCCGCQMDNGSYQVGVFVFCSNNCIMIHGQHYREALRDAMQNVKREYYG